MNVFPGHLLFLSFRLGLVICQNEPKTGITIVTMEVVYADYRFRTQVT